MKKVHDKMDNKMDNKMNEEQRQVIEKKASIIDHVTGDLLVLSHLEPSLPIKKIRKGLWRASDASQDILDELTCMIGDDKRD